MRFLTPKQIESEILAEMAVPRSFLRLGYMLGMLKETSNENYRRIVKKAGLGTRKAYYLLSISEQLRPFLRYRARFERVGWTKCQLIAAYLNASNVRKVIDVAQSANVKQLEKYLQSGRSPKMRCVTLYFSGPDHRKFAEALVKCGATKRGRGLMNKEAALISLIDGITAGR